MKKLERNEMRNLSGGIEDPQTYCTFTMTGTSGPGFCDYWVHSCSPGYNGPPEQDWCDATCWSDCNSMGCSATHRWN